jgi:RNA polymerase sigma-70 factor, ECF subfamily
VEPKEMTDEELIGRVRGGETRLFGELVRRYQDPVFAMALRLLGDASDAEDVAQEAFLRVHRGLEGFKGDAKFSTWLYRITCNLCTDWLRKNRRHGRKMTSLEAATELVDTRVQLERGLEEAEELQSLRTALDGLRERYRSLVILHYYQGLPCQQISEIMGMPMKTVETRLYRARRMLRERLEKSGQEGTG